MKSFPMFIRTSGRRVVIAGGGEQAAQKARLILKTDADIVIAALELDQELSALVDAGRAVWHRQPITSALFDGAAMAFVASGCPATDACLHALAKAARCPVNVVDQPALCDITTPSIVDRDPVIVAIGTEGTAPVLARRVKTQVEQMLPPQIGGLAALAGRLRGAVAARIPHHSRRAFWRWVFNDAPAALWTRGEERQAAALIKSAVATGQAPGTDSTGSIALVGAGPGAKDLLTLRAVQRLQEADVIFYDRLVDPEVLELARRDAERIFAGKHVGAHSWPQDRINRAIIAEARKGRRVVRLKSGDPGVFGRAEEELQAARDAGLPVEIVPGITAASAAASALGHSLTARGQTNTLVLATGTGREEDPTPDCCRHSAPGTTTAFYMSARQADRIRQDLLSRGADPNLMVEIAVNVSKRDEQLHQVVLNDLPGYLRQQGIDGCAVLLVIWPKHLVRQPVDQRPAPIPAGAERVLLASHG